MHGDFTRDTFDPAYPFSRVLLQQGRAQLDADSNEQVAIFWHYLRTLAADLIGPYGGLGDGFKIEAPAAGDGGWFTITTGTYYVDGLHCQNSPNAEDDPLSFDEQPDYWRRRSSDDRPPNASYLVYLDVWERFLTHVQTEYPIREVALSGADTGGRARIVWQVRLLETEQQIGEEIDLGNAENVHRNWTTLVDRMLQRRMRAELRARARRPEDNGDPCVIAPESRYRGLENQLYRVEIYRGDEQPTFTWDRDNGSHLYPISRLNGTKVTLESLGRDERERLRVGDLVEVVDDHLALDGQRGSLFWVDAVEPIDQSATLRAHPVNKVNEMPSYDEDDTTHPMLRRWQGYAAVADGLEPNQDWVTLEDGVQVQFRPDTEAEGNPQPPPYRPGDYWLIPARVAAGDVEWPGPFDDPDWRGPHGMMHHYAPLAYWNGNEFVDLRYTITPLATP